MEHIPAKDLGLATRFGTYTMADDMAERIAADDKDWQYSVELHAGDFFVIAVYDEEDIFLGYL